MIAVLPFLPIQGSDNEKFSPIPRQASGVFLPVLRLLSLRQRSRLLKCTNILCILCVTYKWLSEEIQQGLSKTNRDSAIKITASLERRHAKGFTRKLSRGITASCSRHTVHPHICKCAEIVISSLVLLPMVRDQCKAGSYRGFVRAYICACS